MEETKNIEIHIPVEYQGLLGRLHCWTIYPIERNGTPIYKLNLALK